MLAFINNIDEYNRAMDNFTNASGSAIAEATKQAESLEGRLNALSNTWAAFIQSSLDTNSVIAFVNSLDFIITGLGNIGTLLGLVGGAFVALKLPTIIAWFQLKARILREATQRR